MKKRYINGIITAAFLLTAMPWQAKAENNSVSSGSTWEQETVQLSEQNNIIIEESAVQADNTELKSDAADAEDVTASFTDTAFLAQVRASLKLEPDAPVTKTACAVVEELRVTQCGIESLAGIENFTNLELLECDSNQLTSLDMSVCPNLKKLYCYGNPLTMVDVSGCPKLEVLECGENKLASLDVKACPNLTELSCDSNQLKTLDVSACSKLTLLSCGANQLTAIDISMCPELVELRCFENQLTLLDLSKCPKLKTINCSTNLLNTLDIKVCPKLEDLSCGENQLSVLEISACPELTSLSCDRNNLTKLDLSKCVQLKNLVCGYNQLTELELATCPQLEYLICYGNQLRKLDVSKCMNLEELSCEDNQLTSLNVNGCSKLQNVTCKTNQLKTLDVRKCTNLTYLYCYDNQLTELNVSGCAKLEDLTCFSNQLEALNLKGCSKLAFVSCTYNNMESPADVIGRNSGLTGEHFEFEPQNDLSNRKPQKITVKPGSLELYVKGKAKTLKVSQAKGTITYESSNPKVAKVDAKGKVTPVSKGKTSIVVRAAGTSVYKKAVCEVKVSVYGKPAGVKKVKAAPAKTKRTVKVSWKKADSVSGYRIRYSYKKNMKGSKIIKVPGGKTTSKTIRKLKAQKNVYVQVQAYKADGKTLITGSWSKAVKSKIKY